MNKKLTKSLLILAVLIFNIFVVTDFPESRAKFIKGNATEVKYSTNLSKLSLVFNDDINKISTTFDKTYSRYNKAYINVLISRNNVMYSTDLFDTYTYTVSDTCVINEDSISSNLTNNVDYKILDYGSHFINIRYYNNKADNLTFKMTCDIINDSNISDDEEGINVYFTAKEQINRYSESNTETGVAEEEFTYFNYNMTTTLFEYYQMTGYPNLYTNAIVKIHELYDSYGASVVNYVINYFNTVYYDNDGTFISDEEFRSRTSSTPLKGFTLGTGDSYNFDEYFLGYALTKAYNSGGVNRYEFSSTNDSETVLRYYIDTYGSTDLKTYKENIITYINNNGGMTSFLNGSIIGFIGTDNSGIKEVRFTDSIINRIKNLTLTYGKEISHTTYQEMATVFMGESVMRSYSAITDNRGELYYQILDTNNDTRVNYLDVDGSELLETVVTNATDRTSTPTTFAKFFQYESASHKVLINIYSDSTMTYASVFEVKSGESLILAYIDEADVISTINSISGTTLTTFGTGTYPYTDEDNNEHYTYIIGGVVYDIYTKDGISYVSFTL